MKKITTLQIYRHIPIAAFAAIILFLAAGILFHNGKAKAASAPTGSIRAASAVDSGGQSRETDAGSTLQKPKEIKPLTAPIYVLIFVFVGMMLIETPVAFAIGLSTLASLIVIRHLNNEPLILMSGVQMMFDGLNNFPLVAIPFFILAGNIMGEGGIAKRLVDFANVLVGRFRGGVAHINILTCMFFAGISGSAVAETSSVGSLLIPIMNEQGYEKEFSAAVTISASTIGLIIPPSNTMIVYAVAAGSVSMASGAAAKMSGVSIEALFLAGAIPGIIVGLALMFVAWIISVKKKYPVFGKVPFVESIRRFWGALLALFLLFIVMGGIALGFFTATEASVVAVLYAMFLSMVVYRELKFKDLTRIILKSAVTTAVVMFLIATSRAMSWVLARENVNISMVQLMLSISTNKYVLLLLVNILLLFVGCVLDMTPAVLIFTPILLPVMMELGIHPVHFGIIMLINLCIGLCTPPVGNCMFVGCSVAGTTIANTTRRLIPFYIAMVAVLMLVTYVPGVCMFLPSIFSKSLRTH